MLQIVRWLLHQVVALVGPSGGGKSSIVKLVERFYLPAGGAVRIDGRDVGIYDEKWLRRRVAIVSQEPVLYGRRLAPSLVVPDSLPSIRKQGPSYLAAASSVFTVDYQPWTLPVPSFLTNTY